MSIKENLALVDSNITHQIEACKRVGIHDKISKLPKGYQTLITEEEHIFTEGEKQLLMLARALLSKAEILLLDEITSNIDANMTEQIGAILQDLKQDHTIVLVTHKPEMMALSDRVIVLDKGKVVAKGPNEDVYLKSPLYKELRNKTFASISQEEEI